MGERSGRRTIPRAVGGDGSAGRGWPDAFYDAVGAGAVVGQRHLAGSITRHINGRSETVLEKPAFRDSFRTRRCLIPADGFYEWKKAGKQRQPFHFGMKDGSLFAFAGVWDRWRSPAGQVLESCSILTTAPNELLADVHDRMPVILPRRHYQIWLTAPVAEAERLAELLVPFDASFMKRYAVSPLVNKPQNEMPECAVEVANPETQTQLW